MGVVYDPGSFKDNEGHVFQNDGRIFRTLNDKVLDRMRRLEAVGLLAGLAADGLIVSSSLLDAKSAGLDPAAVGEVVMEHEPIPVVTYPYEWSTGMLRDAALLTLDIMTRCLEHNFILKDATPFNCMFYKGRPIFIDILSIDDYEDGTPWIGYTQFCREFLFPLFLSGYKKMDFRPWMRGKISGITATEIRKLLSIRDFFRPGILTNVIVQAALERRFSNEDVLVKNALSEKKFHKPVLESMIARLRKTVIATKGADVDTGWLNYTQEKSYQEQDDKNKRSFITRMLQAETPKRIIDLGANTGEYTRLAAEHGELVVGLDIDPACVDSLYRSVKPEDDASIVPMVINLLDPTPGQGWLLEERRSLFDRIDVDGFLALALVHHICIGGNVPIEAFVRLLGRFGRCGVVEWVEKSDSMVQKLLRNREDVFPDYEWETFSKALGRQFEIVQVEEIMNGTRRLCWVRALG